MPKFIPGKSGNPGGRPKASTNFQELARKHCPAALAKLVEIMEQHDDLVASARAACIIIERGYGKPGQLLDVNANPFQADVEAVMRKLAADAAEMRGLPREKMPQFPATIDAQLTNGHGSCFSPNSPNRVQ
jgi:hypothetical protein